LLQKREESAISIASTVSDMKIVDMAQASDNPVSPDKRIIYGVSILAALLIVFAIITAKEGLSRKLLYRHEIEAFTSIPVIGEIAFKKPKQLIVVEDGVKSLLAEEFRKIRITLPYLGIGPNNKKILVTSSIAGEGKSFVAANLAQALALTGKRVVLVDMDLHNPSLEKIMTERGLTGVSEFLNGKANYFQIVNKTSLNENLFFIPSGAVPSNPSELICNGKVKDLIDYLENSFDYVIIDTAPVIPVSDAYELSSYCNATLFVVRHKYTPKMLIQRMDESIKINPLSNPAIIFNGVSNRGFVKNSYGYGYGYTYVIGQNSKSKIRSSKLLN
jgi:capsular exopolysaccharide synthesis family protein